MTWSMPEVDLMTRVFLNSQLTEFAKIMLMMDTILILAKIPITIAATALYLLSVEQADRDRMNGGMYDYEDYRHGAGWS